MFVVVNELFVSPQNRVVFERNFPASMQAPCRAYPVFAWHACCAPTKQAGVPVDPGIHRRRGVYGLPCF